VIHTRTAQPIPRDEQLFSLSLPRIPWHNPPPVCGKPVQGCWLSGTVMQFQADILGVPVLRPRVVETTALGAAYLAGLAVRYWDDLDDIAQRAQPTRRFEPAMDRPRAAELIRTWRRALERSRRWLEE
jgi:glycerol kinase